MPRCAHKLTHDGTVAVADGSKLLASVEMEKVDNRPRWATVTDLERTGVPVLCNTSANFSGKGSFPDAASAARWGGCRYMWAEGNLYSRRGA